jgi:hypothetical protein
MLRLTFLGRGLDCGRLMDAVLRVCLAGQTITGWCVPTPHGVVKIVLTVPEDVADAVIRIVLEQDPHATRAPDSDLDTAGHQAVEVAIREARARGEDPGEAELQAALTWRRRWGG